MNKRYQEADVPALWSAQRYLSWAADHDGISNVQDSWSPYGDQLSVPSSTSTALPSHQPDSKADEDFVVPAKPMEGTPRSMRQRILDAAAQPPIMPLLGSFWYSGELSILFADTGVGKSTLAMQIADSISRGRSLFELPGPTKPYKVLIFDFEMSDRQIEARYKCPETGEHYDFAEDLYCDAIDLATLLADTSMSADKAILDYIKRCITSVDAKVVIIDNISYLSMQTSVDAQAALDLMKSLLKLKRELDVSMLVLAHTPKIPRTRPITVNDLAGSKHLANFADSVSGMGRSNDNPDIVYWKQVKASRSGEFIYTDDNVIVMRRKRITPSFLGFQWVGTDSEYRHLRESDPDERMRQREKAQELSRKGYSQREIAEKILGDKNKASTINGWLNGSDKQKDRLSQLFESSTPLPTNATDGTYTPIASDASIVSNTSNGPNMSDVETSIINDISTSRPP